MSLVDDYKAKNADNDAFRKKHKTFSVDNFISKFKNGIARPNRFRVEFMLPSGVVGGAGILGVNPTSRTGAIQQSERALNKNGLISILSHTTMLPARELQLIGASAGGGSYPAAVPFGVSYQPITVSFYTDAHYSTREYFDIWQNAVFNVKSRTINYYNEYTSDVRIHALDREGNTTYSITLKEAYPNSISECDLSFSSVDTLQTVTVSFSYKYWHSDTVQSID